MPELLIALKERYSPKITKHDETGRMKTRAEEARTVALVYYQLADVIEDQERELRENYRSEKVTGKVRDERQSELNARKRELKQELDEKLEELRTTYDAEVDAWAALDGEKITDDAKLFDGHFKLTDDDLTALSTKHRDNIVMQRMIRNYANSNNLAFDAATPLPEQKKQYFWTLLDDVRKSATDEGRLARGFIQDDKQFNSLYGKALGYHGERVEALEDELDYSTISLQEIGDIKKYNEAQFLAWRRYHEKASEATGEGGATE